MALTKARRAELMSIIRAVYGKDAYVELDGEKGAGIIIPGNNLDWYDPSFKEEESLSVEFANEAETMSSCCGFIELNSLQLAQLSKAEVALFELWLHDQKTAGVVATTASGQQARSCWTATEKVLLQAGFKPLFRAPNPNTMNQITLWLFQVEGSTLDRVISKPKRKEKSVAATRTNSSPRTRCR